MLDVNKVIILQNEEKYLILDRTLKDDKDYYYIAKVNDTETDIENNYKLITVEGKDEDRVMVEVTGEDKLREILPLFSKEL